MISLIPNRIGAHPSRGVVPTPRISVSPVHLRVAMRGVGTARMASLMRRIRVQPSGSPGEWRLPAARCISSASRKLFDRSTYLESHRPLAEARTLPGHVFHNREWYEAELKHCISPSWVLAGRAEEISEPGSFLRLDLPGKGSALIVRGKDGQIRAWANLCTHRGGEAAFTSNRLLAPIDTMLTAFHAAPWQPN